MAHDVPLSDASRYAARRDWLLLVAGAVAIVFGVATIRAGGLVLFGNERAVADAGSYVGFVLWFNFIAGFFYVLAGIGMWLRQRFGAWLAALLAAATVAVFIAFGVHIVTGGTWETRTLAAMTLRSVVWIVLAAIAMKRIPQRG